jgi:uncharacterized membrane protein
MIYFNRQDPAFIVEKRFGIGYTVNCAHPLAWTFVALVVAGLALPVLFR